MNIAHLESLINAAATSHVSGISAQDMMALIDLTLLDTTASSDDVRALTLKAEKNGVAALCVLPEHLTFIPSNCKIKRATVINFPTGNQPQKNILDSLEKIITSESVDEIDYVFPYSTYLNGQKNEAFASYKEIYTLCKQHNLTFKAILETGALPSIDVIYELSNDLINIGCDFLKTSTGKIAQGASLPAAFAILSAIKDSHSACGIKLSGGIKTEEQAWPYIQLAINMLDRIPDSSWFRFGASSLLDDIYNTNPKLKI